MSYCLNLISLALLLVVFVSAVVSSHTCECESDGQYHMMQCEIQKYCCGNAKPDWHCCDEDEKMKNDSHALEIGLGCLAFFLAVLSCVVCLCCYKYKKRNTTRDSKVLPSSTADSVIAIVAGPGYLKEKEAYRVDEQKTNPPPDYPIAAYVQAPPSYSQIDLRAPEPNAPLPPYVAPIVP